MQLQCLLDIFILHRDIVKFNDCAGEGVIDLRPFYRKAYKRNIPLKLFEQKKGAAADRSKRALKDAFMVVDTEDDIPPEEGGSSSAIVNPMQPSGSGGFSESKRRDSDDDAPHDVDSDDDDDGVGAISVNKQRMLSLVRLFSFCHLPSGCLQYVEFSRVAVIMACKRSVEELSSWRTSNPKKLLHEEHGGNIFSELAKSQLKMKIV